jgi:hypothetical protein
MGFLEFLFGKPRNKEVYRQEVALLPSGGKALSRQASILDLKVGGVVTYDATDFIVRNRQVYESHGFEWYSFHLVDSISGKNLWIDAEDDDELEIVVGQAVNLDLELPIPNRVNCEGKSFKLDEHGFAKVLIESEDSQPKYAQVEYWDFYEESDEWTFGVEKWGGQIECSLGRYIEPFEIEILSFGKMDA